MSNFNLIKNISDANASGRGLSSAPWNICCNPFDNSKKMLSAKSKQNGRSMIEMLGVLAIIGVLSVGGIAGYSKAMMKYRINKTIEQITLIAGNVRAFFGPQRSYDGAECCSYITPNGCYPSGCPIIKKAKILPDEMITVTDGKIMSITNPFGGNVSLSPESKAKLGDSQALDIRYNLGDNTEASIELASQDWSNVSSNTILYISPNDPDDQNIYEAKAPLSVDEAITACTTPNVTVIMFRLFIDVDPSSEYWSKQLSDCAIASGGC